MTTQTGRKAEVLEVTSEGRTFVRVRYLDNSELDSVRASTFRKVFGCAPVIGAIVEVK